MPKIFHWFLLGLYTTVTIIPRYLFNIINPKKEQAPKVKGKPIIPIIMISLSLSIYFICILLTSRWYVQRLKIKYLNADIINSTKIIETESNEETIKEEYTPENLEKYSNISYLSVDFNDLLRQNKETVAWIKVNNTNVNYSVVQHNDNEYYLKHNFNGRSSIAGWIYGDFRDDFEYFGTNTIIYGHNMTDRTMFGSLVWALKESWYKNEDNQFIKLSTPTSNSVWKIFSIYVTKPVVDYLKTYFEDENEHQKFLDTLTEKSIYNFNEPVTYDNKILTLSTCTDDGKKRVVIHAKMIKAENR